MNKNLNNQNHNNQNNQNIFNNVGEFAGNVSINSLQLPGTTSVLQSYNLVGGKKINKVSDLFDGLAIPSCLLHIPKMYDNNKSHKGNKKSRGGGNKSDSDSDSSDTDSDSDSDSVKGSVKKLLTHNDPVAGVISEDLYDKFLQMAQDLAVYRKNRKTKKHNLVKKTSKKQTKKRK